MKKSLVLVSLLLASSINVLANDAYPIKERPSNESPVVSQADLLQKSNKSYPSWYRGHGKNGLADKDSLYFYREFIGPKAFVKDAFVNEHFYMGTVDLKPGETYPAHNHPAKEIYFVVDGEAQWFVDDESEIVTPGSTILMRNYAVHGWKNLSKDKSLKLIYIWWADGKTQDLGKGARFTNPELFKAKEDVTGHAVPIPNVRHYADEKANGKYGEYPVPGRLVGTTAYTHFNALDKQVYINEPAWLNGGSKDGIATDKSSYYYNVAVGPKAYGAPLVEDGVAFGYMEWKAGSIAPASNHPYPEVKYILDGEAELVVDGHKQTIKAGDVVYNKPFNAHGWKVKGNKPLKFVWSTWVEDDKKIILQPSKIINKDLVEKKETAKHYVTK